VTRDDDGAGIRAVRRAHRAKGLGLANRAGKLGIAARFAVGDRDKRVPDPLLEGGPAEIQRQLECAPPCVEILLELAGRKAEQGDGVAVPSPDAGGTFHFGQELQGGIDEGEAADSPVGGSEVQDQAGSRGEDRPVSHDSSLHQKGLQAWRLLGIIDIQWLRANLGIFGEKTVPLLTLRGLRRRRAGDRCCQDRVKSYGAPIYVRELSTTATWWRNCGRLGQFASRKSTRRRWAPG
jgi:hypothetical protein